MKLGLPDNICRLCSFASSAFCDHPSAFGIDIQLVLLAAARRTQGGSLKGDVERPK